MIREPQRCVWIPADGLAVVGRELGSTQVKVRDKVSENDDVVV
jgi:hypothetical protein